MVRRSARAARWRHPPTAIEFRRQSKTAVCMCTYVLQKWQVTKPCFVYSPTFPALDRWRDYFPCILKFVFIPLTRLVFPFKYGTRPAATFPIRFHSTLAFLNPPMDWVLFPNAALPAGQWEHGENGKVEPLSWWNNTTEWLSEASRSFVPNNAGVIGFSEVCRQVNNRFVRTLPR